MKSVVNLLRSIASRQGRKSKPRPASPSQTISDVLRAQLAVKPQEVVPGQAETADGWLLAEASMGPVPVVAMEPGQERLAPLL